MNEGNSHMNPNSGEFNGNSETDIRYTGSDNKDNRADNGNQEVNREYQEPAREDQEAAIEYQDAYHKSQRGNTDNQEIDGANQDNNLNENNINIEEAYSNINFRQMEEPRNEMNQGDEPEEEPRQERQGIRLHIPVWVVAFLVIVLILDILCMTQFPKVVKDYRIYATAKDRIREADTSQAINDLYNLAEKRSDSTPILVRTIELSMENGFYDTAGYIIDKYLTGRSISDSEYNKIDGYYTKLNNYYNSYDSVDQIFKSADQNTSDVVRYDEIKTKLKALLNQEGQDKAYVYYYLSMMETDVEAAKDYLLKCYELDPECFDVRGQLGVMFRRLGNFEEAKRYIEEALRKDKKDSTALRAMATIAMVEGDQESGLKYAQDAYTSYPDGPYVRETYLIALTLTGNTEEAQLIQSEMTDAGETLDDQTLQLLKGEITLKDYYLGE